MHQCSSYFLAVIVTFCYKFSSFLFIFSALLFRPDDTTSYPHTNLGYLKGLYCTYIFNFCQCVNSGFKGRELRYRRRHAWLVGERGKQIINSRKSHPEHSENAPFHFPSSVRRVRLDAVRISFISLRSFVRPSNNSDSLLSGDSSVFSSTRNGIGLCRFQGD